MGLITDTFSKIPSKQPRATDSLTQKVKPQPIKTPFSSIQQSPLSAISRVTRSNTSETNTTGEFSEINNANDGKKYLESKLLMVPVGVLTTSHGIAIALFQTVKLQGVTKPVKNAIEAAAHLLLELDMEMTIEAVTEAMNEQLSKDARSNTDLITNIVGEKLATPISNAAKLAEGLKGTISTIKELMSQVQAAVEKFANMHIT